MPIDSVFIKTSKVDKLITTCYNGNTLRQEPENKNNSKSKKLRQIKNIANKRKKGKPGKPVLAHTTSTNGKRRSPNP